MKVKCSCGNSFMVEVEFRRHYRKKVNLTGNYRLAVTPNEKNKECIITDLSLGGLSIRITNDPKISAFDELIVNFRLDDTAKLEIEKKIKIIHVDSDKKVGGKFIESEEDSQANILFLRLL